MAVGVGVVVTNNGWISVGGDSEISLARFVHPASKTTNKRIFMVFRQTCSGSRRRFVFIVALRKYYK
jgi:hypothetical protein